MADEPRNLRMKSKRRAPRAGKNEREEKEPERSAFFYSFFSRRSGSGLHVSGS